jgi:hypothetical protein
MKKICLMTTGGTVASRRHGETGHVVADVSGLRDKAFPESIRYDGLRLCGRRDRIPVGRASTTVGVLTPWKMDRRA